MSIILQIILIYLRLQDPKAMRKIQILRGIALLLFILNFQNLQSQSDSSRLELNVEENALVYFTLDIKKGQTLYSICRQFRVDIGDALVLNKLNDPSQISIGQIIKLPLNKEHFSLHNNGNPSLVPVFYKVKPKETLFRVSKVYFSQDVKDMIERNQLSGFSLSIDQELVVGYFDLASSISTPLAQVKNLKTPTDPVTREQPTPKVAPTKTRKKEETKIEIKEFTASQEATKSQIDATKKQITKPNTIDKQTKLVKVLPTNKMNKDLNLKTSEPQRASKPIEMKEEVLAENENTEAKLEAVVRETIVTDVVEGMNELPVEPRMKHVSRKGTAYWDKNGSDYENLMVLHKTASVNSLIKLTNPINKLSTFARVVGQIPPNAFKKNIEVVMSPAVAKKIGIRDSKFQVDMVYQIAK